MAEAGPADRRKFDEDGRTRNEIDAISRVQTKRVDFYGVNSGRRFEAEVLDETKSARAVGKSTDQLSAVSERHGQALDRVGTDGPKLPVGFALCCVAAFPQAAVRPVPQRNTGPSGSYVGQSGR